MKRQVASYLIVIVSFIALLVSNTFAAAWTGSTSEPENMKKIDGKTFYVITNADELAWFAAEVNKGNNAINAVLANDIVLFDETVTNETRKWIPIAKDSLSQYKGIFNGSGFSISGLHINAKYAGFFGFVDTLGQVLNLELKNGLIQYDGNTFDYDFIGTVVAVNKGVISNCKNSINVKVVRGFNYPYKDDRFIGGICGRNYGTINDVINEAEVYVRDSTKESSISVYVAGIVGYNNGLINKCINYSTVTGESVTNEYHANSYVGGIVARNEGIVTNSINYGILKGYARHVGSVVGGGAFTYLGGIGSPYYKRGKIYNSFSAYEGGRCQATSTAVCNGVSDQSINSYFDISLNRSLKAEPSNSGMTTAAMQKDQFAWVLNTTNGDSVNSKVWSRVDGYPVFATAEYLPIVKVVFESDDGTVNRYSDHQGKIKFPDDPESSTQKVFVGWFDGSKKVTAADVFLDDVKLVAKYDYYYYARFYNDDESLIDSIFMKAGEIPSCTKDVKKTSTLYGSFEFSGWDKDVVALKENADYKATYKMTPFTHEISFLDYDSTLISKKAENYGDKPTIPKSPIRRSTKQYSYEFKAWSPAILVVTKPATYKAVYDSTKLSYKVQFMNLTELLDEQTVMYGDSAKTPVKIPHQDGYEFVGWDAGYNFIDSNTVINAVFEPLTQYSVKFKNCAYKDLQVYKDSAYVLPNAVSKAGFVFIEWKNGESSIGNPGDTIVVKDDMVIEPVFEELTQYTVSFKNCSYKEQKIYEDSIFVLPQEVEKSGYEFLEWISDGNRIGIPGDSIVVEKNMVLEPAFKKVETEALKKRFPSNYIVLNNGNRIISVYNIPEKVEYKLFDVHGNIIQRGKTSRQLELNILSAGMYVLQIGKFRQLMKVE